MLVIICSCNFTYLFVKIRGQSIKKPNFFLIYCFTYNLTKLVSFKVSKLSKVRFLYGLPTYYVLQ